MRRVSRGPRWPVAFNMTPLIDVIFLLIIFFLAVNQFQRAEQDVNVELPTASSEHVELNPSVEAPRVIVNVRKAEGMTVSGRTIDEPQLRRILADQRSAAGKEPLEVWVRADRSVPYADVEPILLACVDVGIWKVSFKVITDDRPGGRGGGE